jgi:puromycin-sensitive aminopeptidase
MQTNDRCARTDRRSGVIRCIAFGLVCYGVLACQAEPRYGFASTPGQLPKDVVPSAYRIDLAPDLDQLQFSAREQIDVDVATSTDVVTVNAVDLTIKSVTALGEDSAPAQVTIDAAHESASFHFARPLAIGRHTLVIVYSGVIAAIPVGIYYNDYVTPAGTGRMLVTQFEAHDARRMFPGWDEPVFKATF